MHFVISPVSLALFPDFPLGGKFVRTFSGAHKTLGTAKKKGIGNIKIAIKMVPFPVSIGLYRFLKKIIELFL